MGMELLMDGLKLLVMGMGTVFVFLILMVILMGVLSKVVDPFKHLLEAPAAPAKAPKKAGEDSALAAAVCAAVHFKRNAK